jgi:signal transduction histidine kinase
VRWIALAPEAPAGDEPLLARDRLGPVRAAEELSLLHTFKDREAMVTYLPIWLEPGRVLGAIELYERFDGRATEIRGEVRRVLVRTTVATLAATAAITGLGILFVGRPMKRLVEKARRIGEGDLSGPLVFHQRDEIGELAHEMNQMCDRLSRAQHRIEEETAKRLATAEQLRHADRLTTVGKLASGLAHELGTPLNVVSGRAKMIARGQVSGAEAIENGAIIAEQCDRMAHIIRQLLGFARRRQPHRSPTELGELARQTLGLLAPIAQKSRVTLTLNPPEGPVNAAVDAALVQQALTNLVVNAMQSMKQGGRVTVELGRTRATPPPDLGGESAEYVFVHVEDEGSGIAPEHLPHIFEPFFTTKDVGEGTGLGLSVTFGIVRDHGGWIAVESALSRGSRFSMYLPPAPTEPPTT